MTKLELEQTVIEYKRLKIKMDLLEQQIEPLKKTITAVALKSPGHKFVAGAFTVTLSDAHREIFKLADAKQKLGAKLKPFIEMIEYTILRVS